ncbi:MULTISPECIES: histone-like nucleoid-structuring protein, MvaT/MvaU family [Pseudomonas]
MMVSKVQQVADIDAQIAELQKQREEIISSPGYQAEAEFSGKLRELMGSYDKSLRDVIKLLDPEARAEKPVRTHKRVRTLKRYKNPHTGEVVETKGGNHRTLKAWKDQYGAEAVNSWIE